ncbi:MAG TPA: hypothetical protein VNC50_11685 [Planctomycetia bacterium]|nr:hypothetical protein [Planctomycetia bacterium]
MSRRRNAEELPFSLDSFLDIVANLVGILIRLIVMVGMTVRTLPPPSEKQVDAQHEAEKRHEEKVAAAKKEWDEAKGKIDAENARRATLRKDLLAARDAELTRRAEAEANRKRDQEKLDAAAEARRLAVAERYALIKNIERQTASLESESDALRRQAKSEATLLDRELAAVRAVEVSAGEQEKSLEELRADVARRQAELDRQRLERESLDDQLEDLKKQIAALAATPKPIKNWTHYGAAIAQRVEIEERHYRCLGGRVAATYLEDLVEVLRRELSDAYENKRMPAGGKLGPIGGFSLKYRLTTDDAGGERRFGRGPGFALQQFELEAESEFLGEKAEAALAENSRFRESLAKADPRTHAVTLWVYPDGFAVAKAIERDLHERGFAVALRPLPAGKPISGSPEGSASQAR